MAARQLCGAITAAGTPCKRGTAGREVCAWHSPDREPGTFWTRKRLMQLESLIEEGLGDQSIARKLGTTANGVMIARKRYGLRSRTKSILCCLQIASKLGIGCQKTVTRWIEQGWLVGRRGQRRGGNRQWYVTESALMDFLENPDHWQCWDPNRVVDPDLRDWVLELRNGVRFLSLTEVGRRCFCEPKTVYQWIRKGFIPAVRNGRGNHQVRERDLVGFTPPQIGGPRVHHPDVSEFEIDGMPDLLGKVQKVEGDRWVAEVIDAAGRVVFRSRRPNLDRKTALHGARRAARSRPARPIAFPVSEREDLAA